MGPGFMSIPLKPSSSVIAGLDHKMIELINGQIKIVYESIQAQVESAKILVDSLTRKVQKSVAFQLTDLISNE